MTARAEPDKLASSKQPVKLAAWAQFSRSECRKSLMDQWEGLLAGSPFVTYL
jgi:hypothetical protein